MPKLNFISIGTHSSYMTEIPVLPILLLLFGAGIVAISGYLQSIDLLLFGSGVVIASIIVAIIESANIILSSKVKENE